MEQLERLIERIITRVNINLRESEFDVAPYVRGMVAREQFARYYAFYGITRHHPVHFFFNHSSIAGSYFLGKCLVDHSVLYKNDIRGDELKVKGDVFRHHDMEIVLDYDEVIRIRDSFLVKNLVHSNSHDPESPEEYWIQNVVSMHYANIHGSPVEGSFIGPFATVDLTSLHDCVIGSYAYIQTGELAHRMIDDGQIWVHARDSFDFVYRFPQEDLRRYIRLEAGRKPEGLLMDFVESRKQDFEHVFEKVRSHPPVPMSKGASVSRYAVVKGETWIGENVLVAQRAYLEDAWLGKGSNAQENCYIIHSRLEGNNVTAHGGKIIHACLGKQIFVGFNAFLHGRHDCELRIGDGCIVMPHTIIDLEEPLEIPAGRLIWGFIQGKDDLDRHSIGLDELSEVEGELERGAMRFQGSGSRFVKGFQHRIEHILEANGAFYDGSNNRGHAQKKRNISFNLIQPYPEGELEGLYPTIEIHP